MKQILVLGLLLIFTSGCIEVRDPDKEKKPSESKKIQNEVSQISYEIRPLPQPQRYAVVIRGLSFEAQVQRLGTNLIIEDGETEDIIETSGLISYSILQQGKSEVLSVEIPRDFIIEGHMVLAEENRKVKSSGRLFFKKNSVLITGGQDVEFEFESIVSEGATLMTFKEGQTASTYSPGRSGGKIKLKANRIEDTLHVFMRGENGADGAIKFYDSSSPNPNSINGLTGGNSGLLHLQILDMSRGKIETQTLPGIGGAAGAVRNFQSRKTVLKGQAGDHGVTQIPIIENQ